MLTYDRIIPVSVMIAHDLEKDVILLGRRTNPEEINLYGLPGGKQNPGERAETCACRELFEETGLIAMEYTFLGYIDEFIHNHYLALMFRTILFGGEVKNCEPTKCQGWEWHPRDTLFGMPDKTRLMELLLEAHYFDQKPNC